MALCITRRQASESDRELLYDLLKRALGPHIEATYGPWDEGWQRQNFSETTDPAAHEIVELNGEPIGCLLVTKHADYIELDRVFVLPEHQNCGIGAGLVREVLDAAVRDGKVVRLQVFRMNPAVRLYERLGFVRVGETETHVIMSHAAQRVDEANGE